MGPGSEAVTCFVKAKVELRWVHIRIGSYAWDGNPVSPDLTSLSFTFTQYYIGGEIGFSHPCGIKSWDCGNDTKIICSNRILIFWFMWRVNFFEHNNKGIYLFLVVFVSNVLVQLVSQSCSQRPRSTFTAALVKSPQNFGKESFGSLASTWFAYGGLAPKGLW